MEPLQQSVRVAVIQAAPVFLDPDGCLEKARRLIGQAASKGASLVAFGESWIPGFPIHAAAPSADPLWWELAADFLDKSVDISGQICDSLCQLAEEYSIDVAIGISERDPVTRGSLYSTQLIISAEGQIIGQHRKLRPALNERSVWADGDASSLKVCERGYGILSGLCGCEHQMALPTYALAEQGAQIHVAAWPGGETAAPATPAALWQHQHLLSRAFAAQTGAYVLCASGILAPSDIPEKYREFLREPLTGDSAIIDPRGEICGGPISGETILYANCSMPLIRAAKVAFDCAGHGGRADQLEFRNHALGDSGDEDKAPSPDGPEPEQDPMQGDFEEMPERYAEAAIRQATPPAASRS